MIPSPCSAELGASAAIFHWVGFLPVSLAGLSALRKDLAKDFTQGFRRARGTLRASIGAAVAVAVMQVGVVRVAMHQRRVAVRMRVRLAWRRVGGVFVLVVGVVAVAVIVFERLVRVVVAVAF